MEKIKELVILSGKGGTGKTSLAASFAILAKDAVLADCDVDAADLHLILNSNIQRRYKFQSGREAFIRQGQCTYCALCAAYCRYEAIKKVQYQQDSSIYRIDPIACEGCGVCVRFCPTEAIAFIDRTCGEWMVSLTRCGPMVHARLGVASENSGKLVAIVRKEARQIAEQKARPLILIDGPPGIGCPAIASLTGASLALLITEPTLSGEHDLKRALKLTEHFQVPTSVCVNKWDINPKLSERIEKEALKQGAQILGRIRYDQSVTKAQLQKRSVVETDCPAAEDIRQIWKQIYPDLYNKQQMEN